MFATDDPQAIKRLIREHRMTIDPGYPGECRQILSGRGMRLNYYRADGLTIDAIGELLYDRGVTQERLRTTEVIDLLEIALAPEGNKSAAYVTAEGKHITRSSKRIRKASRKRVTSSAVDSIEAQARHAKITRMRKFECMECGNWVTAPLRLKDGTERQIACGLCDGRPLMRRVDPTFDEVMSQLMESAA